MQRFYFLFLVFTTLRFKDVLYHDNFILKFFYWSWCTAIVNFAVFYWICACIILLVQTVFIQYRWLIIKNWIHSWSWIGSFTWQFFAWFLFTPKSLSNKLFISLTLYEHILITFDNELFEFVFKIIWAIFTLIFLLFCVINLLMLKVLYFVKTFALSFLWKIQIIF